MLRVPGQNTLLIYVGFFMQLETTINESSVHIVSQTFSDHFYYWVEKYFPVFECI